MLLVNKKANGNGRSLLHLYLEMLLTGRRNELCSHTLVLTDRLSFDCMPVCLFLELLDVRVSKAIRQFQIAIVCIRIAHQPTFWSPKGSYSQVLMKEKTGPLDKELLKRQILCK